MTAQLKAKPAATTGGRTDPETIICGIEAEQKKLNREQAAVAKNEGRIVQSLVRIGSLLVELKKLSKKTWTNDLRSVGYEPRSARRLQKLGSSWWGENGLIESVSQKLSSDLHKLEWLCRLSQEQLLELLADHDCRSLSRTEVIREVKTRLGLQKKARGSNPSTTLTLSVQRFVKRTMVAIECWQQEGPAPEAQEAFHRVLTTAFEQLGGTLDGRPITTIPST